MKFDYSSIREGRTFFSLGLTINIVATICNFPLSTLFFERSRQICVKGADVSRIQGLETGATCKFGNFSYATARCGVGSCVYSSYWSSKSEEVEG